MPISVKKFRIPAASLAASERAIYSALPVLLGTTIIFKAYDIGAPPILNRYAVTSFKSGAPNEASKYPTSLNKLPGFLSKSLT